MTVTAVPAPLLLSRQETVRMLGSDDEADVDALVAAGRLVEVRLRPDGPVRFRLDDVLLIANAATAEGLAP